MAIGSGTSARNLGIWGFGQAQDAMNRGQGMLDGSLSNALGSLGQGRSDLNTQYGGAIDRLNPWATAGANALGTYQNSLGLNGQGGNDAAVSAFRAAPGYQYSVDQATDAVARKASALGALGSGNTMQAISDRAQNMADQGYQNWQGQLQGLSNSGQQAATTQAGLQSGLGNQLANLGQSEAQLYPAYAGMGLNNLWQGTNAGLGQVTGAAQRASDSVASGYKLGLGALSAGVGLASIGTGGLNYY